MSEQKAAIILRKGRKAATADSLSWLKKDV